MLKMAPLGTASSSALWLKFAPQLSLCPDRTCVFVTLGLKVRIELWDSLRLELWASVGRLSKCRERLRPSPTRRAEQQSSGRGHRSRTGCAQRCVTGARLEAGALRRESGLAFQFKMCCAARGLRIARHSLVFLTLWGV